MKRYVILAGVNGAGKSTLFSIMSSLSEIKKVNLDEIVREIGDWRDTHAVIEAGKIAVRRINKNFIEGVSFSQETTLCGMSILCNIQKAKKLGYSIEMHYVGLDSAAIYDNTESFRRFAIYKDGKCVRLSKQVPEWYRGILV